MNTAHSAGSAGQGGFLPDEQFPEKTGMTPGLTRCGALRFSDGFQVI
ncbi:MAG: hypothetical protein PHI31_15755 [Desulfuromonadaceae bacterium]|nr:hypothetical protein [Desulfuromonadaceae bacterium]